MTGEGQAEGPLVCVWIRGERGSPGSFGDVTVPDSHQSQSVTQGQCPFRQRLKSEMNPRDKFTMDISRTS